jgi:putative oxidoreductase
MTQTIAPALEPAHRPVSQSLNIAVWGLQVLVALAFLAAGGSKLAGALPMVEAFAKIRIGQWLRVLTGILEVAGAVALLVPRAAFFGSLLLGCVMVGAVVAHLTVLGGSPVPAAVLLALAVTVAYLRRP